VFLHPELNRVIDDLFNSIKTISYIQFLLLGQAWGYQARVRKAEYHIPIQSPTPTALAGSIFRVLHAAARGAM
jgi:hypothetical protein